MEGLIISSLLSDKNNGIHKEKRKEGEEEKKEVEEAREIKVGQLS